MMPVWVPSPSGHRPNSFIGSVGATGAAGIAGALHRSGRGRRVRRQGACLSRRHHDRVSRARRLGKPVKWVEHRHEQTSSTRRMPVTIDTTWRLGSISTVASSRCAITSLRSPGLIRRSRLERRQSRSLTRWALIPNFEAVAQVVVTNKTPNAPYRGSGRRRVCHGADHRSGNDQSCRQNIQPRLANSTSDLHRMNTAELPM